MYYIKSMASLANHTFNISVYYKKGYSNPITGKWYVGLKIDDVHNDDLESVENIDLPFMNTIHSSLEEDGFKRSDEDDRYRDWRVGLSHITWLYAPSKVQWEMLSAQRQGTLSSYVPSEPIPPLLESFDIEYVIEKIQRIMTGFGSYSYLGRLPIDLSNMVQDIANHKEIYLKYSGPLPQAIINLLHVKKYKQPQFYDTLPQLKF